MTDPKHLTGAIHFWPPPGAQEASGGGKKEYAELAMNRTPRESGASRTLKLRDIVKMFPTPRSCDGDKGICTPEGAAKERERRKNGQDLPTFVGGQLNPQFVEWLMGYPIDHTALKDSGTRLSRKLLKR